MKRTKGPCRAHTRVGAPCRRPAIEGGTVCRSHGGALAVVRRRAEARVAVERARLMLPSFGLPADADPAEALLEEVGRTAGAVRWLQALIAERDPESLVWLQAETVEERVEGGPVVAKTSALRRYAADLHPWVRAWHLERDHLVKACKAAIQCGIAERQVRLAEAQGALVASAVRAALGDPEWALSSAQVDIGLRVVARHLRKLPTVVDGSVTRIAPMGAQNGASGVSGGRAEIR